MTQKETVKAEVETKQPEAPSVTVNDLRAARDIIAIASKRGAFTEPQEYKVIGDIYDKLHAFVSYIDQEEAKAKEAEEQAEEQADESTEDSE